MPKLKGNPYYCYLNKTQPAAKRGRFDFPEAWGLQLALTNKAQLKNAKEFGLEIKDSNDAIPHPHVKFTSKVTEDAHREFKRNGGRRPNLYVGKNLVEKAPVMGPESEVAVIFDLNEYDGDRKAIVRAVQVLKHVLPEGYEEGNANTIKEADEASELEDVDVDLDGSDDGDVDPELNDSLDDI